MPFDLRESGLRAQELLGLADEQDFRRVLYPQTPEHIDEDKANFIARNRGRIIMLLLLVVLVLSYWAAGRHLVQDLGWAWYGCCTLMSMITELFRQLFVGVWGASAKTFLWIFHALGVFATAFGTAISKIFHSGGTFVTGAALRTCQSLHQHLLCLDR